MQGFRSCSLDAVWDTIALVIAYTYLIKFVYRMFRAHNYMDEKCNVFPILQILEIQNTITGFKITMDPSFIFRHVSCIVLSPFDLSFLCYLILLSSHSRLHVTLKNRDGIALHFQRQLLRGPLIGVESFVV